MKDDLDKTFQISRREIHDMNVFLEGCFVRKKNTPSESEELKLHLEMGQLRLNRMKHDLKKL